MSHPTERVSAERDAAVRDSAQRDSAGGDSAPGDSALAALLQNASARNRLPDDLISYRATVETEIALVLRQGGGVETVTSIEQIAGTARWNRTGAFEQHLTGHRAQQLAVSVSALSWMNAAWLSPVLYGNRMRTRINSSSDSARRRRAGGSSGSGDTVAVIHPLAIDRDRYYTYSGGDTLVTLQSGERRIPIVRVHVAPRAGVHDSVALFVGDMDLDASRGTLVRLRGYFARASTTRLRKFGITLAEALAYIEYENVEREGKYWLPAVQRLEMQVSSPLLGDDRAVLRIVTRFPAMVVNDTTLDSATIARADATRRTARRRLTYASGDSLSRFNGWIYPLGAITAGLHSDDFNDIAPDRLRPTGRPRFDISATRVADVIHYNRVEGLYTGLGVKLSLRDAAPGVVLRANAGWAWEERTVRGRVSVERTQGVWSAGIRAGRSLDLTNDFRNVLDSGATLGALGSDDPYDYVDRRFATVGVARALFSRQAVLRVDFGVDDVRYAPTRLRKGLFGDSLFKPNRGVDEGGYRKATASFEWHPNVNAEAATPGYSARAYYERGDGALAYQRAELRVVGRRFMGPFTWTVRGDAGEVFGAHIPSQQLFELGKGQNLPGYANKEFAGSRAAVLRTGVMYTSPFLRQPMRFGRRLWLPGIAPGVSAGLQNGWADAPTSAARESILRLGTLPDSNGVAVPVSRVTGGIRSTVSVGVRFFSGTVFAGWARAIDRPDKWRWMLSLNRTL